MGLFYLFVRFGKWVAVIFNREVGCTLHYRTTAQQLMDIRYLVQRRSRAGSTSLSGVSPCGTTSSVFSYRLLFFLYFRCFPLSRPSTLQQQQLSLSYSFHSAASPPTVQLWTPTPCWAAHTRNFPTPPWLKSAAWQHRPSSQRSRSR